MPIAQLVPVLPYAPVVLREEYLKMVFVRTHVILPITSTQQPKLVTHASSVVQFVIMVILVSQHYLVTSTTVRSDQFLGV